MAALSRLTGRLAGIPVPAPLRGPFFGAAARVLGMDLTEARDPVDAYRTLDELFVRHLRAGARSWPDDPAAIASPVDGVVGAFGRVESGEMLQAKGRSYTAAELLDDAALGDRFSSGGYLTLYLAPRHYHRIHAPVGGAITRSRHIPGRLLPVNRPAVTRVDRLFPRNERLVSLLDPVPGAGETGVGAVALVAVGAFNVGRITADFDPALVTNRPRSRATSRSYDPPLPVARGDAHMAFHLGSTVVLLFERPARLVAALEPGQEVRLGQALTAS